MIAPSPEVLRQERREKERRWLLFVMWFLAVFIFTALLIAAFAPAIAAVEGNYIHPAEKG